MALQRSAGVDVAFWCTAPVPGSVTLCTIVVEFDLEKLAQEALAYARDPLTDLPTALTLLEATVRRSVIGTSTAAVLAAAKERGIPASRISDEANLFQLGWGRRQKRIQATTSSQTSHIAVGIARNKQLTKALLDQAGMPVPGAALPIR